MIGFGEHPVDGAVPYFRDPLFHAGLTAPERRPSPQLGEHGEEVRRELEGTRPASQRHRGG